VNPYCDIADPSLDWSGKFGVETGDDCALPPDIHDPHTPRKRPGCTPPCDTNQCNCLSGDVTITQQDDGVTLIISVRLTPKGSSKSQIVSGTFLKSGDSGLVASGTFDQVNLTYDIQRTNTTLIFNDRPWYTCPQMADLNSTPTDWTEIGLIVGGVVAVILVLAGLCFFNPFKYCKKNTNTGDYTATGDPNQPDKVVAAPYTVLPSPDRRRYLN
jgi:hypothetical protein